MVEDGFKFCNNCGAKIPEISKFCYLCGSKQVFTIKYAGFWIRFLAYLIDNIIVLIFATIYFFIRFAIIELDPTCPFTDYETEFSYLFHQTIYLTFIFRFLYFVLLESSEKQSTLGKRIFRLRVQEVDGKRITRKKATIRYLSRFISFITIFGYLMAGFTQKNQTSHDYIANTVVIKRW